MPLLHACRTSTPPLGATLTLWRQPGSGKPPFGGSPTACDRSQRELCGSSPGVSRRCRYRNGPRGRRHPRGRTPRRVHRNDALLLGRVQRARRGNRGCRPDGRRCAARRHAHDARRHRVRRDGRAARAPRARDAGRHRRSNGVVAITGGATLPVGARDSRARRSFRCRARQRRPAAARARGRRCSSPCSGSALLGARASRRSSRRCRRPRAPRRSRCSQSGSLLSASRMRALRTFLLTRRAARPRGRGRHRLARDRARRRR